MAHMEPKEHIVNLFKEIHIIQSIWPIEQESEFLT